MQRFGQFDPIRTLQIHLVFVVKPIRLYGSTIASNQAPSLGDKGCGVIRGNEGTGGFMRLLVFILVFGVMTVAPLWAQEGQGQQDEQISVEIMEQLDGDGDLKVSRKEWTKSPATFNKLDGDGDGFVTVDEFYAYQDRMQGPPAGQGQMGPPMGQGGQGMMGRGGMGGQGRMGQRGGRVAQAIKQMDVNGDGVVSSDEWRGPPQAFQHLDGNGDGSITKEEFQQARQQRRARMGQGGQGMMGRGGMRRQGMMGRGGVGGQGMMGRGGMGRQGMMNRGGINRGWHARQNDRTYASVGYEQ